MKKLVLALLALTLLVSNADAQCQGWEHGQIVSGGQQPNASTAPKPYCWETSELNHGIVLYDSSFYGDVKMVYTRGEQQTYFDWYAYTTKTLYGTEYYGINVKVKVYGLPQNDVPRVTLGSTPGILIGERNFFSPSGDIINGYEYEYFVKIIPTSDARYMSDLDIHDMLKIEDGYGLRNQFFIN